METTISKLTPVFLQTADSKNKLWENDNITERIVICFTVNDKLVIAPMAAYKFTKFPSTKTIEASPGKPIRLIAGVSRLEIISNIGVIFKNVIKKYTGTTILVKLQRVIKPF